MVRGLGLRVRTWERARERSDKKIMRGKGSRGSAEMAGVGTTAAHLKVMGVL